MERLSETLCIGEFAFRKILKIETGIVALGSFQYNFHDEK